MPGKMQHLNLSDLASPVPEDGRDETVLPAHKVKTLKDFLPENLQRAAGVMDAVMKDSLPEKICHLHQQEP